MRRVVPAAILIAALAFPTVVLADSISGTCKNSSGEKCLKGNHTISTSWNSRKGFPDSSGKYAIDFGGTVGTTITMYCDGKKVGTVKVAGKTRFDVVCK